MFNSSVYFPGFLPRCGEGRMDEQGKTRPKFCIEAPLIHHIEDTKLAFNQLYIRWLHSDNQSLRFGTSLYMYLNK